MSKRYQVKNWSEFQHYRDRTPPWIKLHRGIIDDYDFSCLPIASKALAPLLWVLASESTDGTVTGEVARLAHRLRWSVADLEAGLSGLVSGGFFIVVEPADSVLAPCPQRATSERETEGERETETEAENPPTPRPDSDGSRLSALWVGADPVSVPPSPAPAPKPKAATWRDVPIPAVLQTPEFAAAWQEWHDYRRESKYRTWSARTAKGSLDDLAALGVKVAVASIGKAISSGWQGIHPKAETTGSAGRNLPPVGVAVLPSSDADRRDGACRYNAAAKHMERWSADRRVWEPMAPAVPPTAAASTTTTTATGAN